MEVGGTEVDASEKSEDILICERTFENLSSRCMAGDSDGDSCSREEEGKSRRIGGMTPDELNRIFNDDVRRLSTIQEGDVRTG